MNNLIEIKGLCKAYPGFTLTDVDLALPGGSIMGLVGENGAGKTTLIKMILGITRPDSGSIRLLGQDVESEGQLAALKQQVGVVMADSFFYQGGLPRRRSRRAAQSLPHLGRCLFPPAHGAV